MKSAKILYEGAHLRNVSKNIFNAKLTKHAKVGNQEAFVARFFLRYKMETYVKERAKCMMICRILSL